MKYDIRLEISHDYAQPAANGRHVIRVLPQNLAGRQRVQANLLEISPRPDFRHERRDFFGNSMTLATHRDPHARMTIRMSCRVSVDTAPDYQDTMTDLAQLQQDLATLRGLDAASPLHFLGPSLRLRPQSEIADFARSTCDPALSVARNVRALGRAVHDLIAFDARATTVDTPPEEAFRKRRGVCQDMSHIMILALRSLGIPAGYVSGYLRTLPPPGAPRLEGVDAMHAWVRAWCGLRQGWVEYDPTNATLVGQDHIVVAYGRDYADVSPVIGRLRSSGTQVSAQSVDVALAD